MKFSSLHWHVVIPQWRSFLYSPEQSYEDWKCTRVQYVVFHESVPSGVLYNKLMNTMNGITGDVTPLT